jgi:uncharacterized membrane protein (UPF0136 family)
MLAFVPNYLYLFGVLTIAGGVVGFLKAKSNASLIAGGIAGVALLVSGYLASTKGSLGFVVGLVISLALAGRFVSAFVKTRKVMPAGMMSVLSVLGIVLTALALMK